MTMDGYQTFSQERRNSLWQKLEQGDGDAREILILSNELLVWSVVSHFSSGKEKREDLFQAGMIGLMKAVDHFDFRRGTTFATFAVPHILGEVRRQFQKEMGQHHKISPSKLIEAENNFLQCHGRSPTLEELAESVGCEPGDILQQQEIPMEQAEELPDGQWEESFQDVENRLFCHKLFRSLPQRQRQILYERYYRSKTQSEVAADMDISQTRVSRLEKEALRRLEEVAKNS